MAQKTEVESRIKTKFWLIKSKRECYSVDQFARDKTTLWSGIRNYQARNTMMTEMKRGDRFLFYHSNVEHPGIVGVGRIVNSNLPDPSALDKASAQYDPKATPDRPIWFCVKIVYEGHLLYPVTLEKIKDINGLANMALLRKGKRLSIQPVRKTEFDFILKRGGGLKCVH
jgi:predicted RNA-binding protein with PUA-like domain